MARTGSPLRYPGGKASLLNKVASIIRLNGLKHGTYAEPYAGGCGLALELLFNGHVGDIHLNDVDRDIWSFWYSVLNDTEGLVELVETTPLTIEEWKRQRQIVKDQDNRDTLKAGFAAFYLNRTNRSGIIKGAGVIGGLEQKGNYLLDCRFNREDLVRRIQRVAKYKNQIHFTGMDALKFLDFVERKLPKNTFSCIDPPYFNKGSKLYTSFYRPEDHSKVAERVLKLKSPWIITYDDTPEIRELYAARRQFDLSLNYSVQTKRQGQEVLVASKGLKLPFDIRESKLIRSRVYVDD